MRWGGWKGLLSTQAFRSASPEATNHGQSEKYRSVHDLRPVVEQVVEVTTGSFKKKSTYDPSSEL